MKEMNKTPDQGKLRLGSILRARCPACHEGQVLKRIFAIHRRCPSCGYDFMPEPGFYLGAMCVGFLVSAMLLVPPMIILKMMNVDIRILLAWPFVEFLFVGTFIMFYCRILWLHLDYWITGHLDGRHPR